MWPGGEVGLVSLVFPTLVGSLVIRWLVGLGWLVDCLGCLKSGYLICLLDSSFVWLVD